MKSISTINPAIMENTEHLIVKMHASFIDVSWRLILFLAFQTCWATFQAENNVRSSPASSAPNLVLHQSHNTCTANRHLCGSVERNGAQRRTKVNFSRTMMQALELLRLTKRHVSVRSDVEQWRNKAISFNHYWVTPVWRH